MVLICNSIGYIFFIFVRFVDWVYFVLVNKYGCSFVCYAGGDCGCMLMVGVSLMLVVYFRTI